MIIFFIYFFVIWDKLENEIKNVNNTKLNYIDKIAQILIKNNNDIYNGEIWKLFEKYQINELDLISDRNNFKQYSSIIQALNIFKNINIFYLKYNLIKGFSLCSKAKESIEYLSTFIEIKTLNLQNKYNVEDIVKNKLNNVQSVSPLCEYNKNNKIISQTYFKIYKFYVFITFEFTDEHEAINYNEVEILAFNKRITHNNEIIDYILTEKILFGVKYNLIGVINTPESNHYNGIIINLNINYQSLEIGKNSTL